MEIPRAVQAQGGFAPLPDSLQELLNSSVEFEPELLRSERLEGEGRVGGHPAGPATLVSHFPESPSLALRTVNLYRPRAMEKLEAHSSADLIRVLQAAVR